MREDLPGGYATVVRRDVSLVHRLRELSAVEPSRVARVVGDLKIDSLTIIEHIRKRLVRARRIRR